MVVRTLFTTREGGVSAPPFSSLNLGSRVGDAPAAVAENRARLTEHLHGARPVFMDQVHSATVGVVTADAGPFTATDALVSTATGTALVVLVADCVPVLAYDESAGVIGVAHAGRRGAAAGIVRVLLDSMVGLGATTSSTRVLLGPAICGGCYEVPEQMRDQVDQLLPGSGTVTRAGTPGLDLRAGLAQQLRGAGVGVEVDPRCTFEDEQLFGHRRDGLTGRQAGVIWQQ